MSLFVKDERLTSPIQPATRKDRLGADGWIPCGTRKDGWQDCGTGTYDHARPDCAYGLVPPEGMRRAATAAVEPFMVYPLEAEDAATAVLIAAARWEATDE